MLVIISDLHLTDGTCGSTVSPGAFEIFAGRLQEAAVAASWRSDGNYRPIDRIDVLMLGDVFDVIRSAKWSTTPVRPWSNPHTPEFFDLVQRITGDILRQNEPSLAILRGLSESGVSVPPATRAGQPAAGSEGERVPVRLHYMVGNHDWFYHLPGAKFDQLRQKIVRQMGLANPHDEPFPHDYTENEDLLLTLRRHKVAARHGDLFDPFNFEGDRCASSLGDVIVVELINRFALEVETQLADELPMGTVLGLREIDNIRPIILVPVWIEGLLERTCAFPSMRKRLKGVWDRLADEFLAVDFVRQRDSWSPTDIVDALACALKFSKRLSIGWASSAASWFNNLRGSPDASYARHAMAEQDFRNRRARHVVYGHTHDVEAVPLDASYAEGYVLNQMYFNAGTWRRVHRQTQLAPSEREFIASDVMTYLAFYQGDERKGRPFETWSGTLGFTPSEVTVHRIDAGKAHATGPSVPAPNVHTHAPHFASPARKPGIVPTRRV